MEFGLGNKENGIFIYYTNTNFWYLMNFSFKNKKYAFKTFSIEAKDNGR